jgi:IclR family transcriptional regulator, KDG regulon repressor
MRSDLNVRSVARAVSILEQFTFARPELSLTEISSGSGLSKSTAHRLLATLEAAEMVELDRSTAHYRLGLKNFRLGSVMCKSMRLAKQADPLLRRVTEETGETSFLQAVDGNEALCLHRFDGRHLTGLLSLEAGTRSPFNCGAGQRILLAHLPDERWEEIVAGHTRRMTQYSLLSRQELERDRNEIQTRGWVISREDAGLHVCALGAPVRDATGTVVAAVSLAGIVQRFPASRLPILTRRVMQLGHELSRRLGYPSQENNHRSAAAPGPSSDLSGPRARARTPMEVLSGV